MTIYKTIKRLSAVTVLVFSGQAQANVQDEFVIDRNGIIEVSGTVYNLIQQWNGELESNQTLDQYLLDQQRTDLLADFVHYAQGAENYQPLSDYVEKHSPAQAVNFPTSEIHQQSGFVGHSDETKVAGHLLEHGDAAFAGWQFEIFSDTNRLRDFIQENHPDVYAAWSTAQTTPSAGTGLEDWVALEAPEYQSLIQDFGAILVGEGIPGGKGDDPDDDTRCECKVVITKDLDTFGYVTNDPKPTKVHDHRRKKLHYWEEQFYGSHYLEMYAFGKRESFSWEKELQNNTGMRLTLSCLTAAAPRRPCGGCSADLNIYATYGSQLNVHTDTWTSLGAGGDAETLSMDEAILTINDAGTEVEGFNKSLALSQTTASGIHTGALADFISSLQQIGYAIIAIENGDVSAQTIGLLFDAQSDAIQSFLGIVEVQDTEGTSTADMKAKYDSIANANDQGFTVVPNKNYAAIITSTGRIMYDGDRRHQSINTYFGSDSSLVLGLNSFNCDAQVIKPPKDQACYVRSSTYRSPNYGNNTLKNNVDEYIKHILGGAPGTTTLHSNCVEDTCGCTIAD